VRAPDGLKCGGALGGGFHGFGLLRFLEPLLPTVEENRNRLSRLTMEFRAVMLHTLVHIRYLTSVLKMCI
jgi:hypothetical protein